MNNKWIASLSGLLFGAGLLLSGMADSVKVIGFLDLKGLLDGSWDPSLMFVMAGALSVYIPVFHLYVKPRVKPRACANSTLSSEPVCDSQYHLPEVKKPDGQLIFGAGIFGLGWGIAGICPGPALVNLGSLDISLGLFMIAMLTGLYIGKLSQNYLGTQAQA
ncbi:DUF6691 family protein [Shewanella woodyi]|uniref:DUF6691 family protein n=1 Tax=Shewanella woodyi TaxID=60961 RepID=UPI003748904F